MWLAQLCRLALDQAIVAASQISSRVVGRQALQQQCDGFSVAQAQWLLDLTSAHVTEDINTTVVFDGAGL